jgi:hypothetical protein
MPSAGTAKGQAVSTRQTALSTDPAASYNEWVLGYANNAVSGSRKGGSMSLSGILWLVVAVIVVLWLLGLVGGFGGNLIHALLVIALIVIVFNLISGRRAV